MRESPELVCMPPMSDLVAFIKTFQLDYLTISTSGQPSLGTESMKLKNFLPTIVSGLVDNNIC